MSPKVINRLCIVVAALAVVTAFALPAAAQKTKVVFATAHAATGAPERVQVFMEQNPDIEVEIVSLSGLSIDQIRDKLYSMIAAGQPVDVIRLSGVLFQEWVSSGLTLDLAPYFSRTGSDAFLDDMHAFALRAVSRDGKVYGLPEDPTTDWMIVNLGAFDRAGLESPFAIYESGDWTWDTMRSVAARFKALGSVDDPFFPITTLINNDLGLMPWIMGSGGDFFNEDGSEVRINSQEVLRGIEFALELMDEGLMNGPHSPMGWQDIFARDRWGMAIWWVTFPSYLNVNAPASDVDLIPLPRSAHPGFSTPANINTYVISSTTSVPEAAFRLATWLGGPEHYRLALTGEAHPDQPYIFSWPSAYASADQMFIEIVSERLDVQGLRYYRDAVASARAINQPKRAATTAQSMVYEALAKVWTHETPVPTALENLSRELQALISG